eukprot:3114788-Pleurochrysis_carterae.AAC.1
MSSFALWSSMHDASCASVCLSECSRTFTKGGSGAGPGSEGSAPGATEFASNPPEMTPGSSRGIVPSSSTCEGRAHR